MRDEYQIEVQHPEARTPGDYVEEEIPHIFVVPRREEK